MIKFAMAISTDVAVPGESPSSEDPRTHEADSTDDDPDADDI